MSRVVEQIPVAWVMPERMGPSTPLVIWLADGIAGVEAVRPVLTQLAAAGFLAVSFDSWGRGARATESIETLFPRAMANWPYLGWPMLGQGATETLRVLDWARAEFGVQPPFAIGGESLGGDIAVASAGLDGRISCVAVIVATADWRRPGMHAGGVLVPAGKPDAYAQFFYDRINPLTNLAAYSHRPAMTFECGADDHHVPADGALRFQAALAGTYADASTRIRVNLHPGVGHESAPAMVDNCLAWLKQHAAGQGA